jgi:predicted porin
LIPETKEILSMKKSVIALAVAAAIPAFAQAASNVSLYGIVDTAIGYQDNGGAAKATGNVTTGGMSTSRLGVQGTEDLGGGLKGMFKAETVLGTDNGTTESTASNFWQRSLWLAVGGGFGTVKAGRDYTVGFSAAGQTDIMGYGLYGNWLAFTAGAGGIATRASNMVSYTSPTIGGGLTLSAMYSFAAGTGAQEITAGSVGDDDAKGISAVYKSGPLVLQGYYQGLAVAGASDTKQYGAGAGYSMGAVRLAANYGVADPAGNNNKTTGYQLGAGVKAGAGEIRVSYINIKKDANDAKTDVVGVAYVHPMSKRTNLYVNYGVANNNAAASNALYASGHALSASGAGADVSGLMLGIRHTF